MPGGTYAENLVKGVFRRSVSEPDETDSVYKFGGFLVSFSRFNFVLHARGEAWYRCVLRLKINGSV